MQIILNIPDTVAQRVIDALCYNGGYRLDSGLTKAQFARSMIIRYAKGVVGEVEGSEAVQTARLDVLARVESEITIT